MYIGDANHISGAYLMIMRIYTISRMFTGVVRQHFGRMIENYWVIIGEMIFTGAIYGF